MSEQNKDNSFDKKVAESLLSQVSLLIKKNDELLAATGARFNMFKVLGVNHYENMHSKILSELLNPKGSHDMGSVFLNFFLEKAFPENKGNNEKESEAKSFNIDSKNAKVRTEVPFSFIDKKEDSTEELVTGRMDILIEDIVNNSAICIENKVYAGDQPRQIIRYNGHLQSKYTNYRILYLTLDGHRANKDSASTVEYITISYNDIILKWLEECIKLSVERPMIRETLCQFKNHIQKLTGTNLEKKHMDEAIQMICKSKDSLKSAKELSNAVNSEAMRNFIINPLVEELKIFISSLLDNTDTNKIKANIDLKSGKSWRSFSFKEDGWLFSIRFEFKKDSFQNMWCGIWGNKANASLEGYKQQSNGTLVKDVPALWFGEDTWAALLKTDNETENKEREELVNKYKEEIRTMLPAIKANIDFSELK